MKKEKKLISYLIQSHNQENHFFDLINKLNNNEVCFFIHVDKKSNQEIFRQKFKNFRNVFFISEKKRVNIIWKGFSQVQATLNLIEFCLNSEYEFKYFILLSGVDYPIKSNKKILDFFRKTNKNYIDFKKIKKNNSYLDFFKGKNLWFQISKYFLYDKVNFNWNSKTNSIKHQIFRFYLLLILFINFFILKQKIPEYIKKIYFGSSWWILNNESIKYINNFIKNTENKTFLNIFKNSSSSDEYFFQTILLKSAYKKNCINNNLRFIDWNKKREGPAILNDGDFENIKKSEFLFARKFDFKKSKDLKQKIDKYLLR